MSRGRAEAAEEDATVREERVVIEEGRTQIEERRETQHDARTRALTADASGRRYSAPATLDTERVSCTNGVELTNFPHRETVATAENPTHGTDDSHEEKSQALALKELADDAEQHDL